MNEEITFTMASNRSKIILGIIGTISVLVLIAGSVMLAIGIVKFNDAKTTTSTSTTPASIITSPISSRTIDSSTNTQSSSQTPSNTSSAFSTAVSVPATLLSSTDSSSSSPTQPSVSGSSSFSMIPSTQSSFNTELPTTPTNAQPNCQRDIAILIDNSRMAGNLTDFQKQIKFITEKLVNNWEIDRNATEVAAFLYNTQQPKVIGRPFLYYNVQTLILDLQDQLQSFTYFQSDISFGISTLEQNLQNRRSNIPLVTILFTYSSNFDDVISAVPLIPSLNGSLIIVAVGPDTNLNILQYLSGTVILSNIDYSNTGLASTINTAICEPTAPPDPTPATTTTSPLTTTTPASSALYSPCQKFIAFIIDASNDLTDGQFAMQKGSVGLGLPQATHYERFAFGYYSSTASVLDFGRFDSDNSFTYAIAGTKQTNSPPNITRALQAADIGLTVNETIGLATIIFIANPDPNDVAAAIPFAQNLQSKGNLTVVALLNANLTLINQLTPNVIIWNDMGSYNTTTWIPDMENAYGCSNSSSTTTSTAVTGISTTVSQPLTTTAITTTPPGGFYWPCESDIVLAVDVSSSMNNSVFFTEGLFIVINFVNYNWTHYERVGLMSYADGSNRVWSYNTFHDDSTINNPVLQMGQQSGKNNITEGLSTVIASFSQGQHTIRNTVFFTSGSDPADVSTAQPLATQISQKGPLIIIAYGENANVTELQRLNPAKIVYINPNDFTDGYNGYHNYTISQEIYSAFQCSTSFLSS